MMKTMKQAKIFLSMVALAMMGAMMSGCANDDIIAQTPQPTGTVEGQTVTMRTIVSLEGKAATRALTEAGVKTFAVGDQIAVVYKNTSGETVKAVSEALTAADIDASDAHKATFSVSLTSPKASETVRYIYPAAMAAATVATTTATNDDVTIDYTKLTNQDGTLPTLASSLDLGVFDGTLTADAHLPASATLTNPLTIGKFTIKANNGTNDLTSTITSLTIGDGTNTYTVSRLAAAGPIYVAMKPVTSGIILFTGTDGATNYAKTVPGKNLAENSIYDIDINIINGTDLSMLDCAGTARASRWTANSYMVHTAGDYCLPLVYGNAIKNGNTNAAAYTGVSHERATLTYPNHADKAITDPWIKNNKNESGNNITVASAELKWQDAQGLITAVGIYGDYLTLTVGKDATTQEGNAVIAAKDANGTIVWSWHIWVTKQTFAATALTTITTTDDTSTGTQGTDWQIYKVAPTNLGWVGDPSGLGYNPYYQWGRKDAFIPNKLSTDDTWSNHAVYDIAGTDITAKALTYEASTTATIGDNIQNPTKYFYNSENGGPCNTTYYNMWHTQQTNGDGDAYDFLEITATATVKTVYDPCPPGFCLPTSNLFFFIGDGSNVMDNNDIRVDNDWDDTNKVKSWKQSTYSSYTTGPDLYFPATGNREYNNGKLANVEAYGYCHSASAGSKLTGFILGYDKDSWKWNDNFYRAHGFCVRPVAEE